VLYVCDYSTVIVGGTIVVRNGTVQCVGTMVSCQPLLAADCQQYSLTGAGGVVKLHFLFPMTSFISRMSITVMHACAVQNRSFLV
jgi:hypothetical protein